MDNIIYNNEIQCGEDPVIAVTRDQLAKQADTVIHDLDVYLYDHVFNHGCGTVKLYVTKSEGEDVSKAAPVATIEYGQEFVTNFQGQRNEYRYSDDCASAITKKITALYKKHS